VSRKPEGLFIDAIHSKMESDVFRQAMAVMMSNGTPDRYYDGNRDLWVEYKWLPKPPKRKFVPNLSQLQLRWLQRRHAAGANAWVIVGFPPNEGATVGKVGIVVTDPREWELGVDPKKYLPMTPQGLATRIRDYVHT
jgi:hypothetical protein